MDFSLLAPLIGTFLLSAFTTHAVRGYALRRLLDLPNARSSHAVPTPRGGGLGIVVGFVGAMAYLYGQARLPLDLLMALAGGLPVAAVGFWDDHGHVSARLRLLVQAGAAAWALYWLGGFESMVFAGNRYELGWLGNGLAGFFIVWLLNLFNFMDGIDGIAGAEAIAVVSLAAFLALGTGDHPALLSLAAAAGGFLVWNWPPAKIFMGDVGSGFVGFLLGVLVVRMAMVGELSLTVWLILLGVFCVDATLTLLRRMASGQRWYEAHRSHAYQHAAQRWASHRRVTLAVLAINLGWLLPLAALAMASPRWELACLGVAYAPLVGLALRLDAGKS